MRIFLSIKYYEDHRNRGRIDHLSQTLAANGHTTCCIARDFEAWGQHTFTPADLMRLTCEQIRLCALLLVDFTEKGVGLGIEAGYAHALDIPIIVLTPSGTPVSATLQGIAHTILTCTTPPGPLGRACRDLAPLIQFLKTI